MSLITKIQEIIEDGTGMEISQRQVMLLFVVLILAGIVVYLVATDPI